MLNMIVSMTRRFNVDNVSLLLLTHPDIDIQKRVRAFQQIHVSIVLRYSKTVRDCINIKHSVKSINNPTKLTLTNNLI